MGGKGGLPVCLSHPIPPLLWAFLRSASPRSFLQFVRPYWEWSERLLGSSLLEETLFFWHISVPSEADSPFPAPPRSQALAVRRNCMAWAGRGPGEVALRIPSGCWGSWMPLGPPVGQTHGWDRQGCSRDAPACGPRPPPRCHAAEPPPPDLWGHPSAPKKGRTPGRFPGETKLP